MHNINSITFIEIDCNYGETCIAVQKEDLANVPTHENIVYIIMMHGR